MNTQERLSKLKEAQEKISNKIEELKNEIENEKPKYWKPVNGEWVWDWTYMVNIPMSQVYSAGNDTQDNKYAEGELFPTEELCEEHHYEKFYKEQWKRLSIESGEDKNPWDGIHEHWCVCYCTTGEGEGLTIIGDFVTRDANVCFSSYESAENAINAIGEDNVKRYILGIKEQENG